MEMVPLAWIMTCQTMGINALPHASRDEHSREPSFPTVNKVEDAIVQKAMVARPGRVSVQL